MTLNNTVENLDNVPEDFQKFYAKTTKEGDEGGEHYVLNASELFDALSAKNKALDNERKIRSDAEKKAKEYSSKMKEQNNNSSSGKNDFSSVDKEELERLRNESQQWQEEKEKRQREALEAKGEYEKALNNTRKSHERQISDLKTSYDKQIKDLNGRVDKAETAKKSYILNDQVKNAALKAGVIPEDLEDVLVLTRNRFDLDDGNKPIVKGDDGVQLLDTNLEKYFEETFKKAKPKFYQGTNASGTGASSQRNNAPAKNDEELSSLQKIQQGLAKQSNE